MVIERKIGKKSDLNETEHPVLMVWFETSAHLKHLNPSFRDLLYLCEQSGGLYSRLIQDFHLHWGIISVKHTDTRSKCIQDLHYEEMHYLSLWNVHIVMDLRDLHPRPEIEGEKNESRWLDE